MKLTFLGTGGSMGVPVIGCSCEVCQCKDPKNRRARTSALLECGGKRLLIDAGPDFRDQALKFKVSSRGHLSLDGLILSHTHYDHASGLDEFRVFNFKQERAMPCLVSESSFIDLKKLYYYFFNPPSKKANKVPLFDFKVVSNQEEEVTFLGQSFKLFFYTQGQMEVMGFQIEGLAYLTDIKDYDPSIFDRLQGIDTLVIAANGLTGSHVHFSIEEAIEFSRKTSAQSTYLVHLSHQIDYTKVQSVLPEGIYLAYDGLELTF